MNCSYETNKAEWIVSLKGKSHFTNANGIVVLKQKLLGQISCDVLTIGFNTKTDEDWSTQNRT